jgi:hypothetical protein
MGLFGFIQVKGGEAINVWDLCSILTELNQLYGAECIPEK